MSSIPLKLATSTVSEVQSGTWRSDNVTWQFTPAIQLDPKYNWEICLLRFGSWNTPVNISAEYGNNTLRYYNGTTWKTVTLIQGGYDVLDINATLQDQMFLNGDYDVTDSAPNDPVFYINFVPNPVTQLLTIEITNNYQLDLSIGNLATMLGFTPQILTTTTTSSSTVDPTRGTDSWDIHCSLVTGSFDGGIDSDILYGFEPTSRKGFIISEVPTLPVEVKYNLFDQDDVD